MYGIKWTENIMPKGEDKELEIMAPANVRAARAFHESFPQYAETPLAGLDRLAEFLGVAKLCVKDESYRFGLNAFKVLLSHDPTQWRRKVLPLTNIQLTLSGHTHAGQIKILGHSPSALVYSEWDGMYSQDGRALFISSGVGEALVPFRLGAWPKIDIITLHSSK